MKEEDRIEQLESRVNTLVKLVKVRGQMLDAQSELIKSVQKQVDILKDFIDKSVGILTNK